MLIGLFLSAIFLVGGLIYYHSNFPDSHLVAFIISILLIACSIVLAQFSVKAPLKRWQKDDKGKKLDFNTFSCIMLDAPWGSGKTYYYEHTLKKELPADHIYISCFASNKLSLVTQIAVSSSWLIRIISINGLFLRFMVHNWQSLMPKNKTIVFDDIERLHQNDDDYQDLVGIVEYLRNKCSAKVLLIGDMSKINNNIFNLYCEKAVDDFIQPDSEAKRKLIDEILPSRDLSVLKEHILSSSIENIRILKSILKKIEPQLNQLEINGDDYRSRLRQSALGTQIIDFMYLRSEYFKDPKSFMKSELVNDTANEERSLNKIYTEYEKSNLNILSHLKHGQLIDFIGVIDDELVINDYAGRLAQVAESLCFINKIPLYEIHIGNGLYINHETLYDKRKHLLIKLNIALKNDSTQSISSLIFKLSSNHCDSKLIEKHLFNYLKDLATSIHVFISYLQENFLASNSIRPDVQFKLYIYMIIHNIPPSRKLYSGAKAYTQHLIQYSESIPESQIITSNFFYIKKEPSIDDTVENLFRQKEAKIALDNLLKSQ